MTPIIIGGTGGSGTRVVQTVLERAGVFMGTNLNAAKDAQEFEPFLDETINQIMQYTRGLDYQLSQLPEKFVAERVSTLRNIAMRFKQDMPKDAIAWGWKNPRTIYILPFIHAVFPELRFVHVVRDGRDMALSSNQNQLRKHYESIFAESVKEVPNASMVLWSKVNSEIATWAERTLGGRYFYIRFEDLCVHSATAIQNLFSALALTTSVSIDTLSSVVEIPTSLGRYLQAPQSLQTQLANIGIETLHRFGYKTT